MVNESNPKILTMKTESGQTLIDIVLQSTGDQERWFELAQLNGMGITDDLEAGSELVVPAETWDKERTTALLQRRHPASAGEAAEKFHGVDYDAIEVDLQVYP